MSILDKKWDLSQQAQEFFVYQDLGIVPERIFDDNKEAYNKYIKDNTELEKPYDEDKKCKKYLDNLDYQRYCIIMCAKKAYNDLCRTLTYKDDYKDSSNEPKKIKYKKIKNKEKRIYRICVELADEIYHDGNINTTPEELFSVLVDKNDCYNVCITALSNILKVKNEKEFHYGQAQKWVNMTLKYLYLLGIVKNDAGLHIPIDSYILDALSEEGIEAPKTVWSQFCCKEYYDLQKPINDMLNEKSTLPMKWEHEAWMRIAEKRKHN